MACEPGNDRLRVAFVQTPNAHDLQRLAAKSADGSPGSGLILREFAEQRQELERRGVPVEPFHPSAMTSLCAQLPSPTVFVAADLGVTWALLQAMGLHERITPSYPDALDGLLHRHHWQVSGRDLARSVAQAGVPVFVKPLRVRTFDGMRFRGTVIEHVGALGALHPSLHDEPFFCSEVVGWLSEYRCYVMHSRILGIHPYRIAGAAVSRLDCAQLEALAPQLRPSEAFVRAAIRRLDAMGQSVAGYALDFGLSTHAEMSLIEMNDGLALANNGLPVAAYLDLHRARWRELMAAATGVTLHAAD